MSLLILTSAIFGILLILTAICLQDIIALPAHNPYRPLVLGVLGVLVLVLSVTLSAHFSSPKPHDLAYNFPGTTRARIATATVAAGKREEDLYWTVCVDEATGAMSTCVVSKEDATYYPHPREIGRAGV